MCQNYQKMVLFTWFVASLSLIFNHLIRKEAKVHVIYKAHHCHDTATGESEHAELNFLAKCDHLSKVKQE